MMGAVEACNEHVPRNIGRFMDHAREAIPRFLLKRGNKLKAMQARYETMGESYKSQCLSMRAWFPVS